MAQREVDAILSLIDSLDMALRVSKRLKALVKDDLYLNSDAKADEVDLLMDCLSGYVSLANSSTQDFFKWMQ